jgi:hypothetical protein
MNAFAIELSGRVVNAARPANTADTSVVPVARTVGDGEANTIIHAPVATQIGLFGNRAAGG